MGSALLSRFDLVFILLDKPDAELDSMLSEHVMALHAGRKKAFNTSVLGEQVTDNAVHFAVTLYIKMCLEFDISWKLFSAGRSYPIILCAV